MLLSEVLKVFEEVDYIENLIQGIEYAGDIDSVNLKLEYYDESEEKLYSASVLLDAGGYCGISFDLDDEDIELERYYVNDVLLDAIKEISELWEESWEEDDDDDEDEDDEVRELDEFDIEELNWEKYFNKIFRETE